MRKRGGDESHPRLRVGLVLHGRGQILTKYDTPVLRLAPRRVSRNALTCRTEAVVRTHRRQTCVSHQPPDGGQVDAGLLPSTCQTNVATSGSHDRVDSREPFLWFPNSGLGTHDHKALLRGWEA